MKAFFTFAVWLLLILGISTTISWALGLLCAFLIVPFIKCSCRTAIAMGFGTTFIAWAGLAYFIDMLNDHQLTKMIAQLLTVHSPVLLIALTGCIGGIGGALSAWVASAIFSTNK